MLVRGALVVESDFLPACAQTLPPFLSRLSPALAGGRRGRGALVGSSSDFATAAAPHVGQRGESKPERAVLRSHPEPAGPLTVPPPQKPSSFQLLLNCLLHST